MHTSVLRRPILLGVSSLAAATLIATGAPSAQAATTVPGGVSARNSRSPLTAAEVTAIRTGLVDSLQHTVNALAEKSGKHDHQYFSHGVWHNTAPQCLRCDTGPAVASAELATLTGNAVDQRRAVETFDTAITHHRHHSGAFGPPSGSETGPGIQTALFANELGEAYLVLGTRLSTTVRTRWRNAIAGAANYLVRDGNLSWYTNGNITLANSLTMALAAEVTGEPKYVADYHQALSFSLHPPQKRWHGFGLHITRKPKGPVGYGGAGYLAEQGAHKPGFDADYTQLQTSDAVQLYLLTGDPKALWLTTLLVDRLLPRVHFGKWLLNTSNGSRHPQHHRYINYTTAGLPVLALDTDRPGLARHAASQITRVEQVFAGAAHYSNIGMYYGFGDDPVSDLIALSGGPIAQISSVR